jgi:hypothetical protein
MDRGEGALGREEGQKGRTGVEKGRRRRRMDV